MLFRSMWNQPGCLCTLAFKMCQHPCCRHCPGVAPSPCRRFVAQPSGFSYQPAGGTWPSRGAPRPCAWGHSSGCRQNRTGRNTLRSQTHSWRPLWDKDWTQHADRHVQGASHAGNRQNQQRPPGAPSWTRCHWPFSRQDSSTMVSTTNMPPMIWTTCTGRGRNTFYLVLKQNCNHWRGIKFSFRLQVSLILLFYWSDLI